MGNNKFKILSLLCILVLTIFSGLYLIMEKYITNFADRTYIITPLIWFDFLYPIFIGVLISLYLLKVKRNIIIILIGLVLNILITVVIWYIEPAKISTYNLILLGVLLIKLIGQKDS